MSLSRTSLEDGLRRCRELVLRDPALAAELEQSRAAFFPAPPPLGPAPGDPAAALADRRHLEWFLFERPSESLGAVPVELLVASEPDLAPLAQAFLSSQAGVFEVTGVEAGRGIWMRDLFGLGEYPVDEPEAAGEFAPGDLAVGRIFPAGDAVFRLSTAVGVFRNAALLQAMRADAERLRAGRRGTLRVAQSELERMFFAPGSVAAEPADPARARADARAELLSSGAEPELVDELLDGLRAAAREGRPEAVTEALNQLAFETAVDLETARERLVELWGAWRARAHAADGGGTGRGRPRGDRGASRDAVAQALARFDEGRQAGGNLDELFRALEDDLGLEHGAEGDDLDEAPDFPGVVGAVIEEFLWEVGRAEGDEVARRYEPLRGLGEYASSIGVIDNLTERHLLEFAARWVLDRGLLANAAEARDLLAALAAFCRWCEDTQELALYTSFAPSLEGLERSLPRLVELRRRHRAEPLEDGAVFTFARARDGQTLLVDRRGEAHAVELGDALAGLLREGDVVQARLDEHGGAAVGGCYPPELLALVA